MSSNDQTTEAQAQQAVIDQNAQIQETTERFHEGKANSHDISDTKDQRSLSNRVAAAEQDDNQSSETLETQLGKIDPTLPAKMHGNEPSRGAKVDASIQQEEEALIRKMDAKKN